MFMQPENYFWGSSIVKKEQRENKDLTRAQKFKFFTIFFVSFTRHETECAKDWRKINMKLNVSVRWKYF